MVVLQIGLLGDDEMKRFLIPLGSVFSFSSLLLLVLLLFVVVVGGGGGGGLCLFLFFLYSSNLKNCFKKKYYNCSY